MNAHPAVTQTLTPDQQLTQATSLIDAGSAASAVTLLQQVSQANPGTQFDAEAQLLLAFSYGGPLGQLDNARQTYLQVATQFANAPQGFTAQVNLLDIQLLEDGIPFTDYLKGLDALIARAGGPSLAVLETGRNPALQPVSFLTSDAQLRVLASLYIVAAGRLVRRPDPESTPQLFRQALNIETYALSHMGTFAGASLGEMMHEDVLTLAGQLGKASSFPPDQTPPRIRQVHPNHSAGPHSDITAMLNDGNISESQINLASLKLMVDGTDVTSQVALSVRTSRQVKLGRGQIFQKIKVRYRPPQPLSIGIHTVDLTVSDLAGNAADKSWSFNVHPRAGDDRDDEHGDDRCDLEPDDNDDD